MAVKKLRLAKEDRRQQTEDRMKIGRIE